MNRKARKAAQLAERKTSRESAPPPLKVITSLRMGELTELRRAKEQLQKDAPRSVFDFPVSRVIRAETWDRLWDQAVRSLGDEPRAGEKTRRFAHQIATGVSGFLGGMFGGVAVPVESAFTAFVLLRSIAEIARSEGEDLKSEATRQECMRIFAWGVDAFALRKTALQWVPVVGSAGGSAINVALSRRVQRQAQGTFTIRRLERKYGAELVQKEFAGV